MALGRLLHDHDVPWDLIVRLTDESKQTLLRRLMLWPKRNPKKRIFVCHCMGGLTSRLRALGSCMAFAKSTHRELIVIWLPSLHMGAEFSDLFATKLVVVKTFTPKWPYTWLHKWDPVWGTFDFYNYMEMDGAGAKKGKKVINAPDRNIYYKGAFILDAENRSLTNWKSDNININLQSLHPTKWVQGRIDALAEQGLGRKAVALHIRDRTMAVDTAADTRTMDESRMRSFVGALEKLMRKTPDIRFFVSTDTAAVVKVLENKFGREIIMSVRRNYNERDAGCDQFVLADRLGLKKSWSAMGNCITRDGMRVRYALFDLLALAKCGALYASNNNSFTEVAMLFGAPRAKLAGVVFAARRTKEDNRKG